MHYLAFTALRGLKISNYIGLDKSVFETFLFQNSGLQNLTLKGSKFSNNGRLPTYCCANELVASLQVAEDNHAA